MSEKSENLWQKLVAIRKGIDVFEKDGKGYGYDYVTGSQILNKIKKKMDELGVILSPRMGIHKTWIHEYTNKRGKVVKDFVIENEGSYVWINADNPEEREEIPWKFFGQQNDVSQAFGSGLTYSERYFLLKFFGIPTDEDDADARYAEERNPPNKEKSMNSVQRSPNSEAASPKQKNAIRAKIKNISGWTGQTKEITEEAIKNKIGFTSFTELTKAQASEALNALEKWEYSYRPKGDQDANHN
ncbi:ERF family protein [Bacillus albus]|uniref:ERF family protein n=1 Tax=Bacillus albus TaxID=2026189 RepID=UPI001020D029|nr:ERF family protein [Bacillus albus]